jgi:hypothetical protein
MSSTFTKKRLELTITLGTGTYGESVGDTVTVTGLRMSAEIVNVIGAYQGVLQLRAFGLSQELMNRLTTIGPVARAMLGKNKVFLKAGDENGMTSIYEGSIINAWGDYNSAPDVAFNLLAQAGAVGALKHAEATNPDVESADVAQMMSALAQQMGLQFENSGVVARISRPHFDGPALTQVQVIAAAAGVEYTVDRGVLAIWPRGASRTSEPPLISAATGMVGYPSFSSQGISITTIFNPKVVVGGLVEVDSSLLMACGKWKVLKVSHSLSCEMPGGPWFTTIEGWDVKQ